MQHLMQQIWQQLMHPLMQQLMHSDTAADAAADAAANAAPGVQSNNQPCFIVPTLFHTTSVCSSEEIQPALYAVAEPGFDFRGAKFITNIHMSP